ncbi:RDD family protein [Geomicrobium sp. JCM 19038]|uniref:RDD family protein n=1 Tax=Geomicrobium sp. JCM 19038 TaxID=1460635 RepID=UPI00045F4ACD|nr:RDD family protein [Geomicrobium sp. JCM 19038]GAK08942.1 hypothetical protein JCM19038_2742 [Geomicrobium sp. JCM 19038]
MEAHAVGFWKRFLALFLDGILFSLIFIPAMLLFGLDLLEPGITFEVIEIILQLGYQIVLPVLWVGYTVGKRMLGIRIVRMDGSDVTFGTMFMRQAVGMIIYALTLGIGVIVSAIMIASRTDRRAIHDLIARTYVTTERPYEATDHDA